jgi:uncharacterized membrane protein
MKPLFVLLSIFGLCCLGFYLSAHNTNVFLSGRIAMAVMLIFTSTAHFVFYKGMAMMLPQWMPLKRFSIYLTGLIEIVAGICLIIPGTKISAAYLLIAFFILLLPANIIAARKNLDLEKATYTGNGIDYLWFRIPLQLLFIAWVWYFAIFN